MSKRVASFFMLVPGPWREVQEVTRILTETGLSHEASGANPAVARFAVEIVEDDDFASGFKWGRKGPLAKEVIEQVGTYRRAALVECRGLLHEHAGAVAQLGRALRDAGGAAVRMEASGSAAAWQPWLEHLDSADPFRIYESAVLIVEGEKGLTFTCGMHHFDLPDAQVTMPEREAAIAWLDAFCVYQLTDRPVLMSGHSFRPSADTERRAFERWPDHRHDPNDGRHNPFGIWRFLDPGATGIEAHQTVPVLIPSLAAILMASERSNGRPLTRPQVEAIVAKSAAIAMDPPDAMALERSRGYADIEPELAWEQWQIVRRRT